MSHVELYKNWKKRKVLVYNFEPPAVLARDSVEVSIKMMNIPVISLDFFDDKIVDKFNENIADIIAIIFTGSRNAVDYPFAPNIPIEILDNDIPKLGICYGHEILGKLYGANIVDCNTDNGEKLDCIAELSQDCMLFEGLNKEEIVCMRHGKMLVDLPKNSRLIAKTNMCPISGFEITDRHIWGLQFHPEKNHLHEVIFRNFVNYSYKLFHPETIIDK